MAIIRYEDDCIEPTAKIKIEYKGPNPFEAYKRVVELVKIKLNISDDNAWERDFRWDATSDDKFGFFIRYHFRKWHDKRTFTFIEMIFQGDQPKEENKVGNLTISIISKLMTHYFLDYPLARTLVYKQFVKFYHENFYKKIRNKFFEECRNLTNLVIDEIKAALNIK